MKALEDAIKKAKDNARVIGKLLREACRVSPQAAELLAEDLKNPDMSLEKCAAALKDYAKKHQENGCWSCCVVGFEPDNEAVRVILDFYKIPPEWFGGQAGTDGGAAETASASAGAAVAPAGAAPAPAGAAAAPAGGVIDLMSLL